MILICSKFGGSIGKSEAPSSLGASPSVGRLMPVSRPHHLPKMDNALSKRMDDIRKTLGAEVILFIAD